MRRQILEREEWDFSEVPDDELINAWNWESGRQIEREHPGMVWSVLSATLKGWFRNNEVWGVPYTRLESDAKTFLFRRKEQKSIEELPCSEIEHFDPELMLQDVHCFAIARCASKSAILKDFETWLATRETKIAAEARPKRPGRRIDGNAWLCDLAIFRVAEAGYTRKEAAALLDWIRLKGRNSAFTESHFEDAQRDTKRRLAEKKARFAGLQDLMQKLPERGFFTLTFGYNFGR